MTDLCSLTDRSSYVNSSLAENLPSMEEYFSGNLNYPLYVDMRTSSGYVRLLEPVDRNDANLIISVKLKAAIPACTSYVLECHGISKGEYVQVKKENDDYIAFVAYSTDSTK